MDINPSTEAVRRIERRAESTRIQRDALRKRQMEMQKKYTEDWEALEAEIKTLDEEQRLLSLPIGRWQP